MKLRCANCSAELVLERDDPFFVCPFCSSSLYLDRARTFKSFLLPPALTDTSARDLLARELARREIPPAAMAKCDGVLLPFWGVRGQNLQETLPAFSPVPDALQGYHLPSAGAVFYRDQPAAGFEDVPCAEQASVRWEGRADVSSFALYRVPFFRIAYGSGGAAYTAFVEAVSGAICLGATPPAASGDITKRFLHLVLGLFGLFALEAALVPGFGLGALVVAGTALAVFPFVRNYASGGSA